MDDLSKSLLLGMLRIYIVNKTILFYTLRYNKKRRPDTHFACPVVKRDIFILLHQKLVIIFNCVVIQSLQVSVMMLHVYPLLIQHSGRDLSRIYNTQTSVSA